MHKIFAERNHGTSIYKVEFQIQIDGICKKTPISIDVSAYSAKRAVELLQYHFRTAARYIKNNTKINTQYRFPSVIGKIFEFYNNNPSLKIGKILKVELLAEAQI